MSSTQADTELLTVHPLVGFSEVYVPHRTGPPTSVVGLGQAAALFDQGVAVRASSTLSHVIFLQFTSSDRRNRAMVAPTFADHGRLSQRNALTTVEPQNGRAMAA